MTFDPARPYSDHFNPYDSSTDEFYWWKLQRGWRPYCMACSGLQRTRVFFHDDEAAPHCLYHGALKPYLRPEKKMMDPILNLWHALGALDLDVLSHCYNVDIEDGEEAAVFDKAVTRAVKLYDVPPAPGTKPYEVLVDTDALEVLCYRLGAELTMDPTAPQGVVACVELHHKVHAFDPHHVHDGKVYYDVSWLVIGPASLAEGASNAR